MNAYLQRLVDDSAKRFPMPTITCGRTALKLYGGAAAAGIVMGIVITASVIATGNTFGQRCAKLHQDGSPEWLQCVQRLSAGGEVEHE